MKAFEKIPHHRVVEAAQKHGYCLWTLRLSLAAYRANRTLVIDGACSRLMQATRGITAGSGFATEELCCLMLDVCDDAVRIYPCVGLALYVDNLTIEIEGTSRCVQQVLPQVTDQVVTHLEGLLELEVSTSKSVLIASSPSLGKVRLLTFKLPSFGW